MVLVFPTIFLLPKGLDPSSMSDLESQIPSLTYDINEAEVVLGKVSQPIRAKWELRNRNICTEDMQPSQPSGMDNDNSSGPPTKRRKVSSSVTRDIGSSITSDSDVSTTASALSGSSRNIVKVVKLSWFLDCLKNNTILPLDNYLVYQGVKVSPPKRPVAVPRNTDQKSGSRWGSRRRDTSSSQHPITQGHLKRPGLKRETTSEHDRAVRIPSMPDYLHTKYSCQRPTPADSPNAAFIQQLKAIRTTRTLAGDKIGERAYSTAISALASYPYQISCMPGKRI